MREVPPRPGGSVVAAVSLAFLGGVLVHRDVLAVLLVGSAAAVAGVGDEGVPARGSVARSLIIVMLLLLEHIVECRRRQSDSAIVLLLAKVTGQLQGSRSVLRSFRAVTCVACRRRGSFDRTWSRPRSADGRRVGLSPTLATGRMRGRQQLLHHGRWHEPLVHRCSLRRRHEPASLGWRRHADQAAQVEGSARSAMRGCATRTTGRRRTRGRG